MSISFIRRTFSGNRISIWRCAKNRFNPWGNVKMIADIAKFAMPLVSLCHFSLCLATFCAVVEARNFGALKGGNETGGLYRTEATLPGNDGSRSLLSDYGLCARCVGPAADQSDCTVSTAARFREALRILVVAEWTYRCGDHLQ